MPIHSSFHTSFVKNLSVYIGYSFKTAIRSPKIKILTRLLKNIGGGDGMRFVSDASFDWGLMVMRIVSKAITVADVESKGKNF